MKYLYLSFALFAAIFTTTTRAETINCTEITAIPVVITVQGVYCLKGNLSSALTSGNLIDIQANNVTVDFNGFKLGGLAAGPSTITFGVFALDRKNITIRNGAIRGVGRGVFLNQSGTGTSSGHLIEDMLIDGNRDTGIFIEGSNMVVRRNRVVNTESGDFIPSAFGILVNVARNSVIADNLIGSVIAHDLFGGTSGTGFATGIRVSNSALIELRGNTILDTKIGATKSGIDIQTSSDITVIGNRVLNAASTGTVGITDGNSSTNVNCIDNTVAGFTTALLGCDFSAGNNLAP